MGDRKPSIFRFWSSRQQPARQNTASPSTSDSAPTATPRAQSRSVNRSTPSTTNATTAASRRAENRSRGGQSTSSITSSTTTTTPPTENKTPDKQLTSNTINATPTTSPKTENHTLDGQTIPPKAENKTPNSESISNTTIPTSMTFSVNKTLDNQSNSNTTSPISTTLPTSEKKTPSNQSTNAANSPPNSISPSRKEEQITDKQNTTLTSPMTPASTEVQTSKPTTITLASPTKESKNSASTQSLSSSQPVTPSRRATQSRSPPQPSSPSLTTPQRTSQPRSLNRTGSHTPKRTSSTTQSKESRQTTQEISRSYAAPTSASNEKDQKPIASGQESHLNSDGANDYDDQTMDGTSSKHNEVDVMPSKSSQHGTTTTQNIDSSAMNGRHEPIIELNAKLEETKDVKEVMQATNSKANQEAKKEVNDLLSPKSSSEAQIREKAASLPNVKPTNTTSQPKKRSTIPTNHNKSALPIGEDVTLHKDVRDDISAFVNQSGVGDLKSVLYDKPVSVITLAGENRGAAMQMGSNSSKAERAVHIHRNYKINPDESVEATTDGEESSKGKRLEDAKDQPPEAYVNNNTQGINNSIVLNSSVIERNPGVHMVAAQIPKETTQPTMDKASSLGTGKSEKNMTRVDKLTYEPTVRRRCLRGLLLETSDSDPENPEKPRRHGCRVSCQQMDKEN